MKTLSKIDMAEATRLTRQGRLEEAMSVLRGDAPSSAPEDAGRSGPAPTVIDMAPPTDAGGSWTPSGTSGGARPAARPGTSRRAEIPKAPRGFLDRMGTRTGPAPAPRPDGARFEERAYANEAGSRAYKLYVPSGYRGHALPLVVMLHGCTQSPDDFAAGTRMNDVAEERLFLVAYPAQPASANASKCWNWFSAGDQQRDRGEPSLIAGITREVVRDFAVDAGRVYIAGLSAGGAAAAIMGATYPDLYAAIGVHSGLACGVASDMSSALAAMRQGAPATRPTRGHGAGGKAVPSIVFHGDRDRTVNPINGDQVIQQSKAAAELRAAVSRGEAPGGMAYTRTVHTDGTGQATLEQWVLHGAGHAWSGGSPAGSYTDPRGPDASREMARFFLGHSAAPR